MNDLLGGLGEIRHQGDIQLLEFRPQHLLDEALGSFNPNGLTVHQLIAESNTLPSGSLATLSTKGMRQGIRCRCGESPNKQGLPSRFGFVDTGKLALYPAEQNESQRGKSDRICESF